MIGAQSAFLRDDDDFGAIQITDPHGVVALNGRTGEIRLFSWREWLRERGGLAAAAFIEQAELDAGSGRVSVRAVKGEE